VLISSALPEEAAKEVRRAGRNPQMVGVHLSTNVLGKPFGHPIYHPIHEAASELGLPIVIQAGSDGGTDLFTAPVGGGPAATYGEYRALGAAVLTAHVMSLICQGVFEKYRGLHLLIVGGGIAWIPYALWRADFRINSAPQEIPWLRKKPS